MSAVAMLGLGCHSMPILPRLSPEQQRWSSTFPIGRVSAHLTGCASPVWGTSASCEPDLSALRELVIASGVFTSLEEDPARADVVVTFIPSPERPYWTTPAHNPAAFLLAFAGVPFWWSDDFGQQILVEQRASGRAERVDMRRAGTRVMWLFAPLLNLSPDRAFAPDLNREASHLRLHLLEFLGRDRAETVAW